MLNLPPLNVPDFQVAHAPTIERNIMESRSLDEHLHWSRDLLNTILQSIDDGITAQESSGRLLYANSAAARMFGFATIDELLGISADKLAQRYEVFDEEGNLIPYDRRPSKEGLNGKESPPTLVRIRNLETRQEYWAIIRSAPLFDENGHVRLVINISRMLQSVSVPKTPVACRRISSPKLSVSALRRSG